MIRFFICLSFILLITGLGTAQKGTAEPDYYPMGYSGETWTGEVTAVNENSREFTITYAKENKTQTFIGVLPKGYTVKMKDGRDHEVKMSELMGMSIKVYYITKTTKDQTGAKSKTNYVFKIRFVSKNK